MLLRRVSALEQLGAKSRAAIRGTAWIAGSARCLRGASMPSTSARNPRASANRFQPVTAGASTSGIPSSTRRIAQGPSSGVTLAVPQSAYGLQTRAAAIGVLGLTSPTKAFVPEIDFKLANTAPQEYSGDLLALGVFETAVKRDDAGKFVEFTDSSVVELDTSLDGLLSELAQEPDFKTKSGQKTSISRVLGRPFKRVALFGLGKPEGLAEPESAAWQSIGSGLAALAKSSFSSSAALAIFPASLEEQEGEKVKEVTAATIAQALGDAAKGVALGSFQDVRFKSESAEKDKAEVYAKDVQFLGLQTEGLEELVDQAVFKAVRIAAGVVLARQLVNAPANVLTPAKLAQVAVELAEAHSDVLTTKILSKEECEELGMGAYLAVGAASENPPHFIHITYTPPDSGGDPATKLAIVGKGVTFDSGGYNLKAGAGSMIQMMKFDMGGAAAAFGAAKAVAAIQPRGVQVNFIVAACENMISGTGMRPGDIITASNGKTIEVNNTDAEGRLTLADALGYASALKVDKIVDLATLTGACIVALGNDIAGLFTPHDGMAAEVEAASMAAGEKVWRMPMEEGYFEGLKSGVADMVNTGPREGGSITASLFLKRYVDENIPWAHLDIAGPAWNWKKGEASGFAASLLYKWIESHEA